MVSIRTKDWAALALAALSTSAIAAGPDSADRRAAHELTAATNPVVDSRFDLTAGTVALAPDVRARTPAHEQRARTARFGNSKNITIDGPSWSYQTSRRGPVVEMGALGGGAVPDAPFLAHVGFAWQF